MDSPKRQKVPVPPAGIGVVVLAVTDDARPPHARFPAPHFLKQQVKSGGILAPALWDYLVQVIGDRSIGHLRFIGRHDAPFSG